MLGCAYYEISYRKLVRQLYGQGKRFVMYIKLMQWVFAFRTYNIFKVVNFTFSLLVIYITCFM